MTSTVMWGEGDVGEGGVVDWEGSEGVWNSYYCQNDCHLVVLLLRAQK